ncbi:Hint domain-containing protein [Phaeobacter sp.]|uniref:Hint domain-containing protein n=1 Tax=Phaeobacter sp. TaxID=1902409 RepID=UPI0025F07756|nr:Hint domain-containing protein [Phaeobacter sp.]
MSWLAARCPHATQAIRYPLPSTAMHGPLMTTGSICLDLLLEDGQDFGALVAFDPHADWQMAFSIDRVDIGIFAVRLSQNGRPREIQLTVPDGHQTGLEGPARLIYAWDSLTRWGRLTLMMPSGANLVSVDVKAPPPLPRCQVLDMLDTLPDRAMDSGLIGCSINDQIVPAAPFAGLCPSTRIATPGGPRSLQDLKRGDLVLSEDGDFVPILYKLSRKRPSIGHDAIVCLRAPYLGLQQNLSIAAQQRVVVAGDDVDYLFGQPQVRVPAQALQNSAFTVPTPGNAGDLAVLSHVVLPGNQRIWANGALVETLFLGRLRRDRNGLAASALAHLDRNDLPEHRSDGTPVLRSFDAAVLAERRIA